MFKIIIPLFLLLLSSFANSSNYEEFAFRAWGVGGDKIASKVTFEVEGEYFTAIPYSSKNIDFQESSTSGDFYLLIGKAKNTKIKPIQLSSDYLNSEILVKVYKSKKVFDASTFVYETDILFTSGTHTNYSININ